jgi:hypothetical protein
LRHKKKLPLIAIVCYVTFNQHPKPQIKVRKRLSLQTVPQKQKRQGNWIAGPGRPRGSKNARTVTRQKALTLAAERIVELLPDFKCLDAHTLLIALYTDEELPVAIRLEAARAALKVEKPALATTTVNGELTLFAGIADKLGAARQRLAAIDGGPIIDAPIIKNDEAAGA